MKKIERLHVYDPKLKRELGINDQGEILDRLNNPTEDIELDYLEGGGAKMGTSRELIGETVKVGDVELEIPQH